MNFAFQPPTERYSDYFSKNKRFPNELEEGNIEYKLKLDPTPSRFEHLVSQMKWRLCEYGICYYLVGISDDGEIKCTDISSLESSFKVLELMAEACSALVLEKRIFNQTLHANQQTLFMQVCIGKSKNTIDIGYNFTQQLNICFIGPENSGKSTLASCINENWVSRISTRENAEKENSQHASYNESTNDPLTMLSSGNILQLDDGSGSMRMHMLRHRHEILSGRTSSISYRYVSNHRANTVYRLIDTPGLEKYRNTLYKCLTTHQIDLCVIVIDIGRNDFCESFVFYYKLCSAINVPVILILSKIDLYNVNQIITAIQLLHKNSECKFTLISNCSELSMLDDDVNDPSKQENSSSVTNDNFTQIPIVLESCVSSEGLDIVWKCIDVFKSKKVHSSKNSHQKKPLSNDSSSMKFCIEKVLKLAEGIVLYGYVRKGTVHSKSKALIGPCNSGDFHVIEIKTLMQENHPVEILKEGSSGSILINFSDITLESLSGMIVTDESQILCGKYKTFNEFECHLAIYSNGDELDIKSPISGSLLVRGMYYKCTLNAMENSNYYQVSIADDQNIYIRPNDKIYFTTGILSALGQVTKVIFK